LRSAIESGARRGANVAGPVVVVAAWTSATSTDPRRLQRRRQPLAYCQAPPGLAEKIPQSTASLIQSSGKPEAAQVSTDRGPSSIGASDSAQRARALTSEVGSSVGIDSDTFVPVASPSTTT